MNPIKVLLIDDERSDYLIFKKYLSQIKDSNYELCWEYDIETATSKLISNQYQICFIDYNLPTLNGLELIKKIKQQTNKTALILISGLGSDEISAQSIQHGAQSYLAKQNIDETILKETIKNSLEKQKQNEAQNTHTEKMLHLAYNDQLTGVNNRHAYEQKILELLNNNTSNQTLGILLLDIDKFKNINDLFGHQVGDELLVQFTKRLKQSLRESDFIARIGGDEFIVLIESKDKHIDFSAIANNIINCVNRTMIINNKEFHTGVSIGITISAHNQKDVKQLLIEADQALYKSKELGRNTFSFYSNEAKDNYISNKSNINKLYIAISQQKLDLLFHPIVNITNKRIIAIEALIRWPSNPKLKPKKLIKLAEEAGLMNQLGDWIIKQACREYSQNKILFEAQTKLYINLSPSQVSSKNTLNLLLSQTSKFNISPSIIFLDITEESLLNNYNVINIKKIAEAGFQFCLDDFGCNYSSLKQIQSLPIKQIKIEPCFFKDLNEQHILLIKTFLLIAKQLKLTVIAKGIENIDSYNFIKNNDCKCAQGFYFHKPQIIKNIIID